MWVGRNSPCWVARGVPMQILFLDDDPTFTRTFKKRVRALRPDWVIQARSGPVDVQAAASRGSFDVIALDWTLRDPTVTGLDVCRSLRTQGYRSVIVMLTARESPAERLEAYRAGADDHIVKDLGVPEICARLEVAARLGIERPRSLQYGPFRLCPDSLRLFVFDAPVDVSKHQWLLMRALIGSAGDAVAPSELCRTAQMEPGSGYKNLRNEIRRLRRRLAETAPGLAACVVANEGAGYALANRSHTAEH